MAYDIPLPEDDSKNLQDYLDAMRRRGGTALKLAGVLLVVGLLAILLWPNRYLSTATILIEDPEIPPGLVQTTVTTFAARQVQYINQRVMTRTNLAQIIEKFNLFAEQRKYLPTLLMVPDVQKDIRIDVIDMPMQQQQQAAGAQGRSAEMPRSIGPAEQQQHRQRQPQADDGQALRQRQLAGAVAGQEAAAGGVGLDHQRAAAAVVPGLGLAAAVGPQGGETAAQRADPAGTPAQQRLRQRQRPQAVGIDHLLLQQELPRRAAEGQPARHRGQ